jgi:hypothetical protein
MVVNISKIKNEKNDVVLELDNTNRGAINDLRKILYNHGLRTFMLGLIPSYLENPKLGSLKEVVEEQVRTGMKVMVLEFDFLNKPIHLENAKIIIGMMKEVVPSIVVILPKAFANFNNTTEINYYSAVTDLFLKLEERYNEQVRFKSVPQKIGDGFDSFMEKTLGTIQTDQTVFKL